MDRARRIVIIGIQRSGTNFVAELLYRQFGVDPAITGIWKHSFVDEVAVAGAENLFLLVSRHPVMWLQSCLLHTPRDLIERRSALFKDGVDSISVYAQIYEQFYRGWINSIEQRNVAIARYEDVLESGAAYFRDRFGFKVDSDVETVSLGKVPMSVVFSDLDREAYLRMECSLEESLALDFWNRLGDTPKRLGYDFSNISFGAERSIRTLAYQLQNNPSSLTSEQFSRLLDEAPTRFSEDGPVLDRLASEQATRSGDVASIDLRARAILAFDREIESMGLRSGSCITQVDAIDNLIDTLNKIKSKRLEQTFEFYNDEINSKTLPPKMYTDALFYMSDCESRRGNLDKAIELARKAVAPEFTDNSESYVTSPWLFHHLGHLLEKKGSLDEAAVYYGRAEAADPNDYQHPYALSRVLLRLGEFSAAGVAAARAAAMRPSDRDIARHAAWCSHRDAAARMAASELEKGLLAIEHSISLDSNFAPHHYLKAELLDRMGKIESATTAAKRACECDGVAPWHYHFLGHLLRVSGHKKEARLAYETALSLEPGNEHHLRALASLTEGDPVS